MVFKLEGQITKTGNHRKGKYLFVWEEGPCRHPGNKRMGKTTRRRGPEINWKTTPPKVRTKKDPKVSKADFDANQVWVVGVLFGNLAPGVGPGLAPGGGQQKTQGKGAVCNGPVQFV